MKTSKRLLLTLVALLLASMMVLSACDDVTDAVGNGDGTQNGTTDDGTVGDTGDGNGDGDNNDGDNNGGGNNGGGNNGGGNNGGGNNDGGNNDGGSNDCQHVFEGEYFSNESGHWRKCACGEAETAVPHVPADAVRENETASNCGEEGCYDEVVYCSACSYKISSEHKTISPEGEHTPQTEPVIENDTDSTCSVKGTYDEVTYCSVCKKEIIRITRQKELAKHSTVLDSSTPATCEENGLNISKCTVCGYTATETLKRLSHVFDSNGECVCGAHKASEGLTATPSGDGKSCTISGLGSFTGNTVYIPSDIGGVPVTGIDANAFKDNTDIIAIYFSDAITTIGDNAFSGCTNLQKIVFSNTIVSIGQQAFSGCSSLEKISLPDSVTTIGYRAFYNCESVTKIVIGEGVTSIGQQSFYGCKKLERFEFNAINCTDLGALSKAFAFGGTEVGGFDVVIGEKCKRIPAALFCVTDTYLSTDTALLNSFPIIKSVQFPDNGVCTEIGTYAFRAHFVAHTVVFIPTYVTTIQDSAFAGSVKMNGSYRYADVLLALEVDSAPSTFTNWKNAGIVFNEGSVYTGSSLSYVFGATRNHGLTSDGYYWIALNDGTICVYDIKDDMTEANIPATINGAKVTTIANYAFFLNFNLTSVVIPEHVTNIGIGAFYNCLALNSFKYNATNAKIDSYMFGSSVSLHAVTGGTFTVGANVEVLPSHATSSIFSTLIFEKNSICEVIEQDAITGNYTSIVIPKSVKKLYNLSASNAKIFYGGSADANGGGWNDIEKGTVSFSKLYYYTEQAPTYDGYYWTYVDGVPEIVEFVPDSNNKISVGLNYTLSTDGTYYIVSGLGTCEDTQIIIASIFNGLPVREIANNAFYGKTTITSFSLPDGITSIGSNAFYNTAFINNEENYVNGALYIGSYLIKTNSSLPTSYTVKDGTTLIAPYAFQSSVATSVTLTDSVKYICKYAFYSHSKLTTLTLSKNLVSIGENAFRGCSSLEGSIAIPAGQTTVYANTFYNCKKLTEIIIPEGVTTIMSGAFYNCAALTEINLPSTLTSFGTSSKPMTFDGCASLKRIIIPNSVTFIPQGLLNGCGSLEYIELPFVGERATSKNSAGVLGHLFYQNSLSSGAGTYVTQNYNSSGNTFSCTIPNSLTTIKINGGNIGYGCFDGCIMIKEVILPEGITMIDCRAFYDCVNLMKITIPSTVTSIAYNAFSNCPKLYEVQNLSNMQLTLGSNDQGYVATYAKHIYGADGQSKYVTTPDGYVFFVNGDEIILCDYVGKATELTLPENYNGKAYSIGNAAFYGKSNITSIKLPADLISIGSYAFAGCTALTSEITIPNGQTTVGKYTFYNCTALTSVKLSESITDIEENAFYNCTAIKEITIPKNVTNIGKNAFYNCKSVTKLNFNAVSLSDIPYSNSSNYVFASLGASTDGVTVTIGSEVTRIPAYAFSYVNKITTVDFGSNSVCTQIGKCAFYNCLALKELIIPDSVVSVGESAFRYCSSLKKLVLPAGITEMTSASLLMGCGALEELTIPYVGTDKTATAASSTTLFGAIFGTYSFTGATQVNQYYNATSYIKNYIPTSLKKITVHGGTIHYGAFSGLGSVTDITLGKDITVIGERAFRSCTSLKELNILGNVSSVGADAFADLNNLATVNFSGDLKAWMNIDFATAASNPSYVGATVYIGGKPLTTLSVPTDVSVIKPYTFIKFTLLSSVVLHSGVTEIGTDAFLGCSKLIEVYNGSSTLTVTKGDTANGYVGCYALYVYDTEGAQSSLLHTDDGFVFFYDGTTYTLVNYEGDKTSITLPASYNGSTYTIGDNAFSGNMALESITVTNGVSAIGKRAFADCKNLKTVYIGDCVTFIDTDILAGCGSLEELTVPFIGDSKKTASDLYQYPLGYFFGKVSFSGSAPQSTWYYADSFSETSFTGYIPTTLHKLTVLGGDINYGALRYLGSNYFDIELILGDGVGRIETYSIQNSTGITKITLGNNITFIGYYALANTGIKEIVIPDSVTTIDSYAFYGCVSLEKAVIGKKVTSIGSSAFYNCKKLATVYDLSETLTIAKDTSNGYVGYYTTNIYTTLDA